MASRGGLRVYSVTIRIKNVGELNWVFFDLDGTIHNHGAALEGAARGVLRESGEIPGADRRDFAAKWSFELERSYARYLRGECSYREHRREVVRRFAPTMAASAADKLMERYAEAYLARAAVFPDVPPLFFALRGVVKFGLITNGYGPMQRAKIERLGLTDVFSVIVVSDDVGVFKPDRRIFRYALEQAEVSGTRAVFVGDALDSDAQAARRAGMSGVWLNRLSHQRSLDVPTIQTLGELPALMPGALRGGGNVDRPDLAAF